MDQLSNELASNSNGNTVDTVNYSPVLTKKQKKEFDFTRYPRRRIALMFLYLGWSYDGLVTQENTKNTIEGAILEALEKTKLIESREVAMWSRCGRTDKGVSGFRQIGSVTVRSTDISGEGVYWPETSSESNRICTTAELPYDRILNHVLPSDIRVLAWSPAKADFNARFECTSRAYIYLFPKGRLNIEAMQLAANLLVGHHDFRNFCVIDMNNARLNSSYERDLYEVQISPVNSESGPYQMFQLKIRSSGFLWHQIRCIVAVLMTSKQTGEKEEAFLSLNEVPTGIKPTGSQAVDDAVRVLRLVNTSRLHELQTQINECMSELQEITANPKADLSTGRVGH
ncbi:hypothetical protein FO519_003228 [Halicephalobus sp. NKZ332]|nr:hypothetical protein FO519_003228 [Halicephalobus sp. NKZ332]